MKLLLLLALALAGSGFIPADIHAADTATPGRRATGARLSFGLLVEHAPQVRPLGGEVDAGFAAPPALRAIEGAVVEITGYMLPVRLEGGRVRELILLRSQAACCFGATPLPGEFLVVRIAAPGLAPALDVPVTLRGTFRLEPVIAQGEFLQLYALEVGAGGAG